MAEQEEKRKPRSKEIIPPHIMERLEEIYFKFGRDLNFYRHNSGLKLNEVGIKLGWEQWKSRNTIGLIEKGVSKVKLQMMVEIASLFGYTLELRWVPITKAKVASYDDIIAGNKPESEIELLGNQKNGSVATEPLTHKEKENEHRPPD